MKLKLLMFFIFIGCCLAAKGDILYMVVENRNGDISQYEISDNPKVYIDHKDLKIQIGEDVSVVHDLKDVQKFYYTRDNSGVGEIVISEKSGNLTYTSDGNIKVISEKGGKGYVYDLDGKIIESFVVAPNIETVKSISHLPQGGYVISLNSESIKVMKR